MGEPESSPRRSERRWKLENGERSPWQHRGARRSDARSCGAPECALGAHIVKAGDVTVLREKLGGRLGLQLAVSSHGALCCAQAIRASAGGEAEAVSKRHSYTALAVITLKRSHARSKHHCTHGAGEQSAELAEP